MKHDSTRARGVSRGELRSIQPPAPDPRSEEQADESPTRKTNYDADPDDTAPTLLAW